MSHFQHHPKHLFWSLITLLFAVLANTSPIRADDLSEAHLAYKEAIQLMKEDHRSNAGKSLVLLKKARALFSQSENLSEANEQALMKTNSHIYWQSKFSSQKSLTIEKDEDESKKKRVLKIEPNPKKALLMAEKEEMNKIFDSELQKVKQYEEQHRDDNMSHLLNYMDLQTKVVGADEALEILEKTKYYNEEHMKLREQTINKYLSQSREMSNWLHQKKYKKLYRKMGKFIKNTNIPPKEQTVLKHMVLELMAMGAIKGRLTQLGTKKALPLPRNYLKLEGVVIEMNEKGLRVKQTNENYSFLSWSVISEATILELGMSVLDNSQTSDLFLLALASLKLERYVDAFETFQQLIEINPTNYLRYRDYLSMCETGYRIKYGDKIERALQGIQRLTEKGHLKEAAEALLQCKKDFVENELGKCYIERFSLTYKEIFRS